MLSPMKKIASLLLVSAILFLPLSGQPAVESANAEVIDRYDQGFLEDIDGRKILHVKGSYFQMGYQYGVLVGNDLEEVTLGLDDYLEGFGVPWWLVDIAKYTLATAYRPFFPPDDMEYLRGIYLGAARPFTVTMADLILINAAIDIGGLFGEIFDTDGMNCSSFAAWGYLTEDGKTFQDRNVDLETGTGLEDHVLVVYNKPDGEIPYAAIGWTGLIGCASGLSADGIGIGQIWGMTVDHTIGTPWALKTRRILAEAGSAEEAAELMCNLPFRTYGSNFVFGDGSNFQGRAVETTWHHAASFTDNDPAEDLALYEGECYAIKIENAVFRADCAMDPEIRALQTAANGPDGDPREASSYINRYKGQADRIIAYRDEGIPIGKAEAESISTAVAMRGSSLQCVVYANTDREFWAANSRIEGSIVHDACDEEYYHYDFSRYLPTGNLSANGTTFGPFDRMTISLETSNKGREAELDTYVYLKHGDEELYLPALTPVRTVYEEGRLFESGISEHEIVFDRTVGWGLIPLGWSTWTVELIDPETGDLIDSGTVPVHVRVLAD